MCKYEKQGKALLEIMKELDISQAQIVRDLNEKGVSINTQNLSKCVKGERTLTKEALNAMYEIYHVNPKYLKGTSDEMYPEGEIAFQTFSQIFPEWHITEYIDHSIEPEKEDSRTKQYLHLKMDSSLYNFLINFDKVEQLKEQGLCFGDIELRKYRDIYYKNSKQPHYQEYLLIPRDEFLKLPIVGTKESIRKHLSELLNFWDHRNYPKSKTKFKIRTNTITSQNKH